MKTLSTIAVHPIKALDPLERGRTGISRIGGLEHDRKYAIVDDNGDYVNGKSTSRVHRIRSEYDAEAETVTLSSSDSAAREFHLDRDREALESWFGSYFDTPVSLRSELGGALTDGAVYGDGTETGPTLVSRATLREVASWFDGISPAEMRLRLRPNLVVDGVPPFWEDRLTAGDGTGIRIGDVRLEGTEPVPRCVVPTRDPHTGERHDGFRTTLVENREETLPSWAPRDQFDHFFKLMVGTRVPAEERTGELRVGDPVTVVDG
ncbi:MOSC domain-containing protein [Halorarum halobium]|uniref:MOSC domain-containing protein n=1 Tax=Halorarum halobium TaxID=3075121 RepID=UPI0028A71FBA|nr:MOSC N-terminal beta barrel domain-containing protein [Halobaculum sp. XH14]